jgi:hypothetical protein
MGRAHGFPAGHDSYRCYPQNVFGAPARDVDTVVEAEVCRPWQAGRESVLLLEPGCPEVDGCSEGIVRKLGVADGNSAVGDLKETAANIDELSPDEVSKRVVVVADPCPGLLSYQGI